MPVITVTLMEGYDEPTRERLAEGLTRVAKTVTGAPMEGITVALQELPAANHMRGGTRESPVKTPSIPSEIVRAYLGAMEARNLETATRWLASPALLTFPGGASFTSLEAMTGWARSRYLSIGKTYERFDETDGEDGAVVVCQGTLHGEWLDGTKFEGIRFVDWFLIRDERIVEQRVWNDLSESLVNA